VNSAGRCRIDPQLLAAFTVHQSYALSDGDTPGREAATAIAERLVRKVHVRIVGLPDRQQPDRLSSDELDSLLT